VCEGYHDQHQVIEWFWGVVERYNGVKYCV